MRRLTVGKIVAVILTLMTSWATNVEAERLKELADLRGARPNQLVGYGLVIGLAGTGDGADVQISRQAVQMMLKRLGTHVDGGRLNLANVASVVVTADLPAFAAAGQRLDVTVSSIGNAKSLQGGTLLMTPLKGADLVVYAVAQGPVSVGGFTAGGSSGSRIEKNHTTVGRVPGGAIVERNVEGSLPISELEINLRNPDFTTAVRVAKALDAELSKLLQADRGTILGGGSDSKSPDETERTEGLGADGKMAEARDAGTVIVKLPESLRGKTAIVMATLEGTEVEPDQPARVVVNERTGTVVLGDRVRLAPVAIAHGGLTLEVHETPQPSQPGPFSSGRTTVVPSTQLDAREVTGELRTVPQGASLGEVVRGLNALGMSPRDLIAILQAIKSAGALRAELVIQ
ncbi:MAG: flagellar basal body P-ring protein FlgI [Deltaproteobacteria bacterium]|nr:flagellar basal body P-ring protein FlgI [Deltaproteobacteria bacterium]